MIKDYEVKRISPELLPDLLRLYQSVHRNTEANLSYFERKFDTAFLGGKFIGFLAYKNSDPVAYYGLFPVRLLLEGRPVIGAQSGDTMTHADHRKKGLFVELAKLTFELAAREGIRFIYGIPNQYSFHGLIKLGWAHRGNMTVYQKPVSPHFFIRLLRKISKSGFRRKVNSIVYSYIADQKAALPTRGEFKVDRSSDYIKYKKSNNNSFLLDLKSGLAWVQILDYTMHLGDFYITGNAREFWESLHDIAKKAGSYSISFHASPSLQGKVDIPDDYSKKEGLPFMVLDLGLNPDLELSITGMDYDTF